MNTARRIMMFKIIICSLVRVLNIFNNPLTDVQKENNTIKSKTRARVEYVFDFMEQSINGLVLR